MKEPERQTYFLTLSGNAEGRISPGEIKYSFFIRLCKYPIPGLLLSRRFVQNHELALQLEDLTVARVPRLCEMASVLTPRQ